MVDDTSSHTEPPFFIYTFNRNIFLTVILIIEIFTEFTSLNVGSLACIHDIVLDKQSHYIFDISIII